MIRRGLALFGLLLLAACAGQTSTSEKLSLSAVSFADLPGWASDHTAEAIPALARSCPDLQRKKPEHWTALCNTLAAHTPQNDTESRAFFQQWFTPYAASGSGGAEGLFTGYYEAELHGAAQQGGVYQTPLYARPNDLIDVDLGDFKSDLKGQHITGKVDGRKLKPYDDRAAIAHNSLQGRAQILAWVDDPIDAFFLEVQGSGRVQMNDGSTLRLGYDGANGRAYVAIGKALADRNEIAKPVTMQSIRDWLKTHPDRAEEIMNLNPSYVFFRRLDGDGPVGAEGIALIPTRSMAVDPAFVTLGTPIWLDTTDGKGAPLQRLMLAQDTGGAIKGPVRGDFFWGFGADAAAQAGAMQSKGHYYLLLPKTMTVADAKE